MENEKLFEFMTKMYSEMQQGFNRVEGRLEKVEKTVTTVEQEHGKKIEALLDGYNRTYENLLYWKRKQMRL